MPWRSCRSSARSRAHRTCRARGHSGRGRWRARWRGTRPRSAPLPGAGRASRQSPSDGYPIQRVDGGAKQREAVAATQQVLAGTLGMRHQAHYVAAGVRNAGDVAERSVGVRLRGHPAIGRAVAKDNLPVALDRLERLRVRVEIALAMRDRDAQYLARTAIEGKGGFALLHPKVHPLAAELAGRVPQQRHGEQPRLLQDLETIADPEHQSAAVREVRHHLHHRGEAGDRATAQLIAIAETHRQYHELEVVEALFPIIDVTRRLAEDVRERVGTIPVTPGARENDDAGVQVRRPPPCPPPEGEGTFSSIR